MGNLHTKKGKYQFSIPSVLKKEPDHANNFQKGLKTLSKASKITDLNIYDNISLKCLGQIFYRIKFMYNMYH